MDESDVQIAEGHVREPDKSIQKYRANPGDLLSLDELVVKALPDEATEVTSTSFISSPYLTTRETF